MAVDLFPYVVRDGERISVCGVTNRHLTHSNPIRHLTVNIIPAIIVEGSEVVLFHRRCPHKKVGPNLLDVAGGHLTLNDFFYQELDWNGESLIAQASQFTAFREGREEIMATPPVVFKKNHFHRFREVAHYECETEAKDEHGVKTYNYEYSTAYVVVLKPRHRIWFVDDCPNCNLESEAVPLRFDEMLRRFRDNPDEFADGAARVLQELSTDESAAEDMRQLVRSSRAQA